MESDPFAGGTGKMKSGRAPLSKFKPYPGNPRIHPKAEIDILAEIIKKRGADQPIVVDEKWVILKGHGRLEAATQAGLAEFPYVQRLGLSESEKTAIRIEDNSIPLLSGWDKTLLSSQLTELKTEGYDMKLLGFGDAQLVQFTTGIVPPDQFATLDADVREPPKTAVTKKGDLWILGDHRILCGDCTDETQVAVLMDGNKGVLCNTDPPYGVDYVEVKNGMPGSGFANISDRMDSIENDDLTDGPRLQAFLERFIRAAVPHLRDDAAFYFWHPMLTQGTFFAAAAAAAADILIHRQIIWVKPHFVLTRSGMYHWKHELCFFGWRRGNQPPWYGDKGQVSVWEIGQDSGTKMHPTQKPVELFDAPILNHSKEGEVIYEPFSGSGSQILAAETRKRRCFAMEIAPGYVDLAIDRWQAMTARDAVHADNGATFSAIAKKRKRK